MTAGWQRYASEVSSERLMASVAKIAQWERVAGTPDELRSFLWLRDQLRSLGADTVLHNHDAFISVPTSASLHVSDQSLPCQTHSMVPSTGAEGVSAQLAYGGKPSELTIDNCKGRIVIIEGRAEREPVIKAQNLGAAGVIFVSGDHIYESCLSPVWGSPSHLNRHLLPAIPVVSITVATGGRLREIATDAVPQATLRTEVDSGWRKTPLLVAEFKAQPQTDEFVMFSGHVDSWYFGAMDNGSANATMIEVGRIAGLHRRDLRRNLRLVFFSGHSQGRYAGSSWYSDSFWEDIHANCMISVNIDSVGGMGADDLTRATIMPEAKWLAAEVIREQTGVDFVGRRYSRFADQSFWGAGVSCAFASFSKQPPAGGSPDLGWWWHTPEDTVDKIDPQNLLRDARIFAAFVMFALTRRVNPLDFRESAAEILGILHDWQKQAGSDFSLVEPIARTEMLIEALERLYARKPDELAADAAVDSFNRTVRELGRLLVPLNYTCGNAFENDPAVAQPPMPSLSSIGRLAKGDGDARKEVQVDLIRRRNYVQNSLSKALGVLCA